MQNCQGLNGRAKYRMCPAGTSEEVWIEQVKDTAVEEEALPPTKFPPWKTPRVFWLAGKTDKRVPKEKEMRKIRRT